MKLIKSILGVAVIAAILVSCSTSDKVVSGKFIQKRKYNKGLHVNLKGKMKKPDAVTLAKTSARKATATKAEAPVATAQEVQAEVAIKNAVAEVASPSSQTKVEEVAAAESVVADPSMKKVEKKIQKKLKKSIEKKSKASPTPAGGKSQLIALILCFVAGVLGIHRFYLGYIGIGVIQLLTAGGCGIWALIDLIMIIMGKLEPADGPYDETL